MDRPAVHSASFSSSRHLQSFNSETVLIKFQLLVSHVARYTTKHLNDETTPKATKNLLAL